MRTRPPLDGPSLTPCCELDTQEYFQKNCFVDFPEEVELVRIPDPPDHDIEIDVLDTRPVCESALPSAWPRLHGVKLVLSMMAGTEWIPPLVGPHVTICNARGAHNVCTAEWTLTAILSMLK